MSLVIVSHMVEPREGGTCERRRPGPHTGSAHTMTFSALVTAALRAHDSLANPVHVPRRHSRRRQATSGERQREQQHRQELRWTVRAFSHDNYLRQRPDRGAIDDMASPIMPGAIPILQHDEQSGFFRVWQQLRLYRLDSCRDPHRWLTLTSRRELAASHAAQVHGFLGIGYGLHLLRGGSVDDHQGLSAR